MTTIKINAEAAKKHGLRPFDIAEYLDSEEMIQAHLSQIIDDGDNKEFLRALGHIARARKNMGEICLTN